MIRRSWRYVLAFVVLLALVLGGGYWYWNRPAPQPTLEQLPQADGSVMTRVTPAGNPKARVAVAVMADETLTDSQLLTLSQGGKAQIVQVVLPKDDCKLQEQALQDALPQLSGPATLVSGIGPAVTTTPTVGHGSAAGRKPSSGVFDCALQLFAHRLLHHRIDF